MKKIILSLTIFSLFSCMKTREEELNVQNSKIIGKWEDQEKKLMEREIFIYTVNDSLKLREIYEDKTFTDRNVTETKESNTNRRFNVNSESWYILDENMHLSSNGVNGKYNDMIPVE